MLNESAALGSELPFLDFVFGFCVSLERGWRDWRETLLDQQAGKSVPGILIRIQNSLLHKLKWVLKSLVKVHGWGRGGGGFVCFPERISTFFLYFYVVKCFPGSNFQKHCSRGQEAQPCGGMCHTLESQVPYEKLGDPISPSHSGVLQLR